MPLRERRFQGSHAPRPTALTTATLLLPRAPGWGARAEELTVAAHAMVTGIDGGIAHVDIAFHGHRPGVLGVWLCRRRGAGAVRVRRTLVMGVQDVRRRLARRGRHLGFLARWLVG